MPKSPSYNLFRCYIWLINTIGSATRPISREEIDRKWAHNISLNPDGESCIPERTFHHWRHACEELFQVNIVCQRSRSGGSYYIENLSNSIAEHAWKLFQTVEAAGGALKAIEEGTLQAEIEKSCQKRDMDIATRRCILLGTNQYPNTKETMAEKIERVVVDENEGLKTYRGAVAFEEIRIATEKYAQANHRPVVFLLKIGNLAMRQARAGFITNFFGCAGYEIVEPAGFNTVEEGIKAAMEAQADIIAVCSSDEEYPVYAPEIIASVKQQQAETICIIAGNPTESIDALKAAAMESEKYVLTIMSSRAGSSELLSGLQELKEQGDDSYGSKMKVLSKAGLSVPE